MNPLINEPSFAEGDRVKVNYTGTDAGELRDKGIETEFTGTIIETRPTFAGWMHQVEADNGSHPYSEEDNFSDWIVMDYELEAA